LDDVVREPSRPQSRWPGSSRPASLWDGISPIREELFSVERVESHARSLAAAQTTASKATRGLPLAARLADNGAVLLSAYRSIVTAIDEGRAITPASEWMIDNYHLVEKQILQISLDLPPGYYRQLPKLLTGPLAGYPRVFGMAWAFVAHTDSSFDSDILVAFFNAYQQVQPLTIGELWAASITLQIVLIENLRRLAEQITLSRKVRHQADGLADRLLGVGGRAPEDASIVFAGHDLRPCARCIAARAPPTSRCATS
jgi:cyclic beta-1,2-glucan synthetase